VLRLQKKNTINNIKYIFDLVKLCEDFKNELKNENYRNCGKIINESWRIKKNLSKKITNNTIDDYIDLLFKNGIYGCKLLGAGMGGFILCLADPGNVEKIIKQNQNMRIVKFKFENKGTQLFSV
jgi:D-glycero-alpha-D-manno-heptose-7-phosphate kinase